MLEDTADLTTTRWLSFGTNKICVFGQRRDHTAFKYLLKSLISRQVTLKVTVLINKFRKPGGNCPEQGSGGRRGDSWGHNGDLLRHTGPDVQRPLSGQRQRWLLIGLVLIMGPKALPRQFVMPGLWQAADTGFACDSSVWYITSHDSSSEYNRRKILWLFGHSARFQCYPLNKLWISSSLSIIYQSGFFFYVPLNNDGPKCSRIKGLIQNKESTSQYLVTIDHYGFTLKCTHESSQLSSGLLKIKLDTFYVWKHTHTLRREGLPSHHPFTGRWLLTQDPRWGGEGWVSFASCLDQLHLSCTSFTCLLLVPEWSHLSG